MQYHHYDDRTEHCALDWINNPSAPHNDADEAFFLAEFQEAKLSEIDNILDRFDHMTGKEENHV